MLSAKHLPRSASLSHIMRDGAYASVPSGGRYALPGELADEPALVRLRELCAAWGVTPRTTDPVTDRPAVEVPSSLGTV